MHVSVAIAAIVMMCFGCTTPSARRDGSATTTSADRRAPTIDHLSPPRDSVGSRPSVFEWTPVDGAHRYAIGVWNEVDVLIWRQDRLREPSAKWPEGVEAELGTYFWSVTAVRNDQPIAESGRSAFVIVR
jgi:hypothetical protein